MDETTILTVTGSLMLLELLLLLLVFTILIVLLVSSRSPSSEVRQELVLTSEYSDGTALIGLGGFLGEELLAIKEENLNR